MTSKAQLVLEISQFTIKLHVLAVGVSQHPLTIKIHIEAKFHKPPTPIANDR